MIELAQNKDGIEIIDVIRTSILSCVLDHQNDPQLIEAWLKNKTVPQLNEWMNSHISYIYREQDQIMAFILFSKQGHIFLNYVLPQTQQQGIGKQLINHTINILKQQSINTISVESTLTAAPFYEKLGFQYIAPLYEHDTLYAYNMAYIID